MRDITDFEIGQGETFSALISLKNRSNNNTPLNIQDYTFTGQVRENYTTEEIAAQFLFEKVLPYTSGSVVFYLQPDDTINLTQRSYVYDVYISSGSFVPYSRRILEGSFTVRPAVTK